MNVCVCVAEVGAASDKLITVRCSDSNIEAVRFGNVFFFFFKGFHCYLGENLVEVRVMLQFSCTHICSLKLIQIQDCLEFLRF